MINKFEVNYINIRRLKKFHTFINKSRFLFESAFLYKINSKTCFKKVIIKKTLLGYISLFIILIISVLINII